MPDSSTSAAAWHRELTQLLERRDLEGAIALIERKLEHDADDARLHLQYARCLSAAARIAEARVSADTAMKLASNDARLLDAIGTFYSSLNAQLEAADACSKAIALDPMRSVYWFNRAAVLRFLGNLDMAEADYDQAIRLAPDDCEAYLNRTELRLQTPERNHIDELERLLGRSKTQWHDEVQVRYALAKEYEDLGQYVPSWQHLESGARLRRAHLQYDIRRDIDTVQWIIEAFPQVISRQAGDGPSPRPIFIVGLPRSGSTLVERILGSHSEVFAAGELSYFAQALTTAAQDKTNVRPMPRQQLIEASRTLDLACLGDAYLSRVRSLGFVERYFIDKMPLNYLYCGLIRMALPRARIVHVTRHPMASCYAMFKTLFRDGYPFSYDLGEIAAFYASYRRLMRHWHDTMPGFIHDISYEQLVAGQEAETRRLLEACGLEWQDACMHFHSNPAASRTASASQVRRPLYDSAIRQWRNFGPQLERLRTGLLAAGIQELELA